MKKKSPSRKRSGLPRDPRFRSRKRQGEFAELMFMLRASELGFAVSKPHNHSAPYDVVIEKDGHVWLIQVKSVIEPFRHSAYQINACIRGGERRPYRLRDVDFMAVWVMPLDMWYIIPVAASRTTSIYLRPLKPAHGRRLERYREQWQLLEPGQRKFGRRYGFCPACARRLARA